MYTRTSSPLTSNVLAVPVDIKDTLTKAQDVRRRNDQMRSGLDNIPNVRGGGSRTSWKNVCTIYICR